MVSWKTKAATTRRTRRDDGRTSSRTGGESMMGATLTAEPVLRSLPCVACEASPNRPCRHSGALGVVITCNRGDVVRDVPGLRSGVRVPHDAILPLSPPRRAMSGCGLTAHDRRCAEPASGCLTGCSDQQVTLLNDRYACSARWGARSRVRRNWGAPRLRASNALLARAGSESPRTRGRFPAAENAIARTPCGGCPVVSQRLRSGWRINTMRRRLSNRLGGQVGRANVRNLDWWWYLANRRPLTALLTERLVDVQVIARRIAGADGVICPDERRLLTCLRDATGMAEDADAARIEAIYALNVGLEEPPSAWHARKRRERAERHQTQLINEDAGRLQRPTS